MTTNATAITTFSMLIDPLPSAVRRLLCFEGHERQKLMASIYFVSPPRPRSQNYGPISKR